MTKSVFPASAHHVLSCTFAHATLQHCFHKESYKLRNPVSYLTISRAMVQHFYETVPILHVSFACNVSVGGMFHVLFLFLGHSSISRDFIIVLQLCMHQCETTDP